MNKLSDGELDALKRAEMEKQHLEDDQRQFFNQPRAAADFDYWSKMTHWTLDEAIALSFGKAPEVVNEKSLKGAVPWVSPFVREYRRTRELADRALAWKQLYDPILSALFVKWAQDNHIPVPDDLVASVEARSEAFFDWKARYEGLLAQNNANVEKENELIEAAKSRIAELENTAKQPKQLHTKERESLLKLVIGMAVSGYAYDPDAARSPTTSEIADDLVKSGVPLDEDTVRKWLREARELLPGDISAD